MTTITQQMKGFFRYLRNNRAVSALEYAILAGVITVGVAAALGTFSEAVTSFIGTIGTQISSTEMAEIGKIGDGT
jgi:Flp pilus assembly pilin Flp